MNRDVAAPASVAPCLLLIDADPSVATTLGQALSPVSLRTATADEVVAGFSSSGPGAIGASGGDIVLLDLHLPGGKALDLLDALRARDADAQVIMLSRDAGSSLMIEAMSRGAFDVLVKPLDRDLLRETVRAALDQRRGRGRAAEIVATDADVGEDGIIARSRGMIELLKRVGLAARGDAPVLLLGERGTGRKLLARAIHRHGARAARPFHVLDSAGLPESLLERELFGEVAGPASPPARGAERGGLLDQAEGGALYFDAIEELSPRLQLRLLRLLTNGDYRRAGAEPEEARRADVRVYAASSHSPDDLVRQRRLLPELLHALNAMPLVVPPLRDRPEDLEPLLLHFIRAHRGLFRDDISGVEHGVIAALREYPWPGNVRELEGAVKHALGRARGRFLRAADFAPLLGGGAARPNGSPSAGNGHLRPPLPGLAQAAADAASGGAGALERVAREALRHHLQEAGAEGGSVHDDILERVERAMILACYEECRRNQSETARRLGISRNNLRAKLKEYGLLM